jgi:hypothetical protein
LWEQPVQRSVREQISQHSPWFTATTVSRYTLEYTAGTHFVSLGGSNRTEVMQPMPAVESAEIIDG